MDKRHKIINLVRNVPVKRSWKICEKYKGKIFTICEGDPKLYDWAIKNLIAKLGI